ncbi:MAG: helix-turn-helix domain-containing protein [Hyphomicrobium sp.]
MDAQQTATARGDPADDLNLESIETTARALGCSRRTVYALIERGELRTVHIGRRHLVPRGERLRYVRTRLERER